MLNRYNVKRERLRFPNVFFHDREVRVNCRLLPNKKSQGRMCPVYLLPKAGNHRLRRVASRLTIVVANVFATLSRVLVVGGRRFHRNDNACVVVLKV